LRSRSGQEARLSAAFNPRRTAATMATLAARMT
jgi:hypothetical protein